MALGTPEPVSGEVLISQCFNDVEWRKFQDVNEAEMKM